MSDNWYKHSKAIRPTKNVVIDPDVKDRMESLGWLDSLTEELNHIAPSVQSGQYRVSLDEHGVGRDFSIQLEISPTEVRVVKTFPVQFDNSPLLETTEHRSVMERVFAQKAVS